MTYPAPVVAVIESKEAETDYTQVYEDVSKQVADVNMMLQHLCSRVY
jgi:hypothetical protein